MISFISATFNPATVIQQNAVFSWQLAEIPVFLANAASIPDVTVIPGIMTEADLGFPGDSPVIRDMIRKALPVIKTPMVGLINADILIEGRFGAVLQGIVERYGTEVFLTGVRRDLDWDSPITSREGLEKVLAMPFKWHQDASADIFITSKALWAEFCDAYQDFILGRLAWDNAIHSYFVNKGVPCYNASGFLKTWHQKHGYDHLSVGDFLSIQRDPRRHPSTTHNSMCFSRFMGSLKDRSILRVGSFKKIGAP